MYKRAVPIRGGLAEGNGLDKADMPLYFKNKGIGEAEVTEGPILVPGDGEFVVSIYTSLGAIDGINQLYHAGTIRQKSSQ